MRAAFCICWLAAAVLRAEVLPEDRGAVGLWQSLKRLQTNARVLYVTAHPDDEDPALLTYLSRGLGVKVTMLILTRGESGANVISGDFFERLGALRTQEMQRAAQYYGVEVRYTRAFDYGYSKNIEEALRQWKEQELLAQVLEIAREVNPQIIISRFNDSARDGHGHHQMAGRMARLAFRDLPSVSKFYTSNWRAGEDVTLAIDAGKYEPLLGRSYAQIGREGYRMHRSQGMSARVAPLGPVWSYLKLEGSRVGFAETAGGLLARLPGVTEDENVTKILSRFDALHPERSAPGITDARALALALGLELEASSDARAVVQPGSALKVKMEIHARGVERVFDIEYGVRGPVEVGKKDGDGSYPVRVLPVASFTSGNWIRRGPRAAMYEPGDMAMPGSGVRAYAKFIYRGRQFELEKDLGVVVGPALSLNFDSAYGIVPAAQREYEVGLTVRNLSNAKQEGVVQVSGALEQPFVLLKEGEEITLRFRLKTPVVAETRVEAVALVGDAGYRASFSPVSGLYRSEAAAHVLRKVDVKVAPGLRVGYVMGSGDAVPEGLRQLGVPVTLMDEAAVATGDLSQFTSIVLGIRAYAARPELSRHSGRLLDYVKTGGTVIVQYQTQEYDNNYGPYPYVQGRNAEDVSEEDAPVKVLAPEDAVFHAPNDIVAADWEGWVEQRGSKFFTTWAPEWRPLVELQDRGQAPQQGAWLSATYGKGNYVYCAMAWYRQLPFAVPGAFRLFANLLSLGK